MEGLGIDLKLIIFQLINFLILLGILSYLLHKPLVKLLENRRKEIAEGLANAAKAKEALEKAEAREQEMLAEAERQGHALIEEVRRQAKELEKNLETSAADRAAKMQERAEEELRAERENLRRELKGELATMVTQATSKVLGDSSLTREKHDQIEKIVSKLP